jgi:hypothetical protein
VERVIEVSTPVRAAPIRARDVLLTDAVAVVGETSSRNDRRARRCRTALSVEVGAGTAVRQEVELELGMATSTTDGVTLPLAWHATGHGRLFPAFHGELEVRTVGRRAVLRLHGSYVVPLGLVGRFGDGVAGRRLARQSLVAFLEHVAARLDAVVDRQTNAVAWRPAPYPVAVDEHVRTDLHIG